MLHQDWLTQASRQPSLPESNQANSFLSGLPSNCHRKINPTGQLSAIKAGGINRIDAGTTCAAASSSSTSFHDARHPVQTYIHSSDPQIKPASVQPSIQKQQLEPLPTSCQPFASFPSIPCLASANIHSRTSTLPFGSILFAHSPSPWHTVCPRTHTSCSVTSTSTTRPWALSLRIFLLSLRTFFTQVVLGLFHAFHILKPKIHVFSSGNAKERKNWWHCHGKGGCVLCDNAQV